ncbi:hypothetical protein KBY67_03825 [Synechococcus sp. RedBA-s]|nr:hypothetical protein [Synechococcus sp. RedBA-s]
MVLPKSAVVTLRRMFQHLVVSKSRIDQRHQQEREAMISIQESEQPLRLWELDLLCIPGAVAEALNLPVYSEQFDVRTERPWPGMSSESWPWCSGASRPASERHLSPGAEAV